MPVVAGRKEIVGMLSVDGRQPAQEVDDIGLHPADLAGDEGESVHADPHG